MPGSGLNMEVDALRPGEYVTDRNGRNMKKVEEEGLGEDGLGEDALGGDKTRNSKKNKKSKKRNKTKRKKTKKRKKYKRTKRTKRNTKKRKKSTKMEKLVGGDPSEWLGGIYDRASAKVSNTKKRVSDGIHRTWYRTRMQKIDSILEDMDKPEPPYFIKSEKDLLYDKKYGFPGDEKEWRAMYEGSEDGGWWHWSERPERQKLLEQHVKDDPEKWTEYARINQDYVYKTFSNPDLVGYHNDKLSKKYMQCLRNLAEKSPTYYPFESDIPDEYLARTQLEAAGETGSVLGDRVGSTSYNGEDYYDKIKESIQKDLGYEGPEEEDTLTWKEANALVVTPVVSETVGEEGLQSLTEEQKQIYQKLHKHLKALCRAVKERGKNYVVFLDETSDVEDAVKAMTKDLRVAEIHGLIESFEKYEWRDRGEKEGRWPTPAGFFLK